MKEWEILRNTCTNRIVKIINDLFHITQNYLSWKNVWHVGHALHTWSPYLCLYIYIYKIVHFVRINFYLLRTFCPHLGSFFLCVVSSFTTFRPNFTSGLLQVILPRPRIGMLSLVTVSPVITAFHSCCLSVPVAQRIEALSLYGSR